MNRLIRCGLSAVVLSLMFSSVRAEIVVVGDTLTFVPPKGKPSEELTGEALSDFYLSKEYDRNALWKIVRFQNELRLGDDGLDVGQSSALSLVSILKRRVIQGIQFAVPKNKKFAVVMAYHCTMEQYGAEFPFVCQASVITADAKGEPQGGAHGNYLHLQVHDELPYFF